MIQLLQAHSSTLYLASLVLLSLVCLAILLKASDILYITRKMTVSLSEPLSASSVIVTGSSYLPASMVNKIFAAGMLMVLLGGGVLVNDIMQRFHRSQLVKLEDVHVLAKYDANSYCMEVQTSPQSNHWKPFSAHTCDPLEADVVPGATLPIFYFAVDSNLQCYDWNAEHAGYTVWRNNAKQPILSSFPRSPTPQCTEAPGTTSTSASARP